MSETATPTSSGSSNDVLKDAAADGFLTFLHLSDIHFKHRQGSAQFDLESQLRKPLLDDIQSKPAEGAGYDGLFITGDIAFSGKKDEYDTAKAFLEKIYGQGLVLPERTYVVPGNHDVNRDMVVPNGAIWNNHAKLREISNKVLRRGALQTQLTHDPACDPLAILEKYNEFAQGYGCRSTKGELAWCQTFPLKFNDGSSLRIHGLNSALNSDDDDDVGKLYVSPFQTQRFGLENGIIDLVLCHHPPHWLLDKAEIEDILNAFVRVALFGHEHSHRVQRVENTVHLYAGAVHPAARDPEWLPTYHILHLKVEGAGASRKLIVRIYSRELRAANHVFVPRSAANGSLYEERRIDLPEWHQSQQINVGKIVENTVTLTKINEMPKSDQPNEEAQNESLRELLVYFHRLSTPVRYIVATSLGLIRDGDEGQSQELWDAVFQRATEEKKLDSLWKSVAEHNADFAKRPNPFQKT